MLNEMSYLLILTGLHSLTCWQTPEMVGEMLYMGQIGLRGPLRKPFAKAEQIRRLPLRNTYP